MTALTPLEQALVAYAHPMCAWGLADVFGVRAVPLKDGEPTTLSGIDVVPVFTKHVHQWDALVVYLPDHGEAVYDNDSNMSGHVEEHPNRYMLEVPLIIYGSPAWRATHPEKWQQICAAVQRPYMTDDMIHTLLDLLNIRTPEYDASKSLVNAEFKVHRTRIIQGMDYDHAMK